MSPDIFNINNDHANMWRVFPDGRIDGNGWVNNVNGVRPIFLLKLKIKGYDFLYKE